MSGGTLRLGHLTHEEQSWIGFYALDVGRGFATLSPASLPKLDSFYALDVGRGFATIQTCNVVHMLQLQFLCPRCRAGLCDVTMTATPR